MKSLNVTNNKYKLIILPVLIVIAGIVFWFVNGGFNFDIEFKGGIRMQIDMKTQFDNDEVYKLIKEKANVDAVVQNTGDGTKAVIKTPPVEESVKNDIFAALKEKYGLSDEDLLSVGSASASFGGEVQQKAFLYTIIAILLILVYIAIRFEWRSAVMAVATLALNILVMLAVYAIFYVPLNTTFIAAMLTVVGYSINNTIVVFDRIRENMRDTRGKTVSEIVNISVGESMGRTINTTITTLITIVLLYILGVQDIKEFAFPLIVGVIAGAYSSIFIASPFWAAWKEKAAKKARTSTKE